MLLTVVFHSVCQFHASGKGQKALFAFVWAVFVIRLVVLKVKICVCLQVLGVKRQFCCKHGQCVKMSRSSGFPIGKKTAKTNHHVIYLSFCVILPLNLAAHWSVLPETFVLFSSWVTFSSWFYRVASDFSKIP